MGRGPTCTWRAARRKRGKTLRFLEICLSYGLGFGWARAKMVFYSHVRI
ncbi:hypothetical protein E1A91_A12G188700v1 [Gossypium mustelinum]|uniref:Uncharacterized protein n=1 Tax=Gossypium mustelinum TaxID=34275 RepID=A0A5D2WW73_GOSMU|nr:hypothetical protein E1A91_A12G188700v1 [Gossypium mustelinum]